MPTFTAVLLVLPPSVRLSLCITGSRTINIPEKNNIDEKNLFGGQLTFPKRATIEKNVMCMYGHTECIPIHYHHHTSPTISNTNFCNFSQSFGLHIDFWTFLC